MLKDVDIRQEMPKPFRFLFFALFTYGASMIIKELEIIDTDLVSAILRNLSDPVWLALFILLLTLGLVGLWLSLIALAFINSLIPKSDKA